MFKNRLAIVFVMMCLILGTVPFTVGATPQKSTSVYISDLYVGAPHENINQEYVKVTNKGTESISMNGWEITDDGNKHQYYFPPSYTLKSKSTVTIYTGKGTNTAKKLYWGMGWYVWNNDGDKAYLYDSQGNLVSTRNG